MAEMVETCWWVVEIFSDDEMVYYYYNRESMMDLLRKLVEERHIFLQHFVFINTSTLDREKNEIVTHDLMSKFVTHKLDLKDCYLSRFICKIVRGQEDDICHLKLRVIPIINTVTRDDLPSLPCIMDYLSARRIYNY